MVFVVLMCYISYIYFFNNKYKVDIDILNNKIVYGPSTPRGKIYDRNGVVLVDNKSINNLVFHYVKGINKIDVAKKVAKLFEFEVANNNELIEWYKANFNENDLLTQNEADDYKKRKITNDEKNSIVKERILNIVNDYSDYEKKCAKVYNLINKGYEYETKFIKKDITPEEINKVLNANIAGTYVENSFERFYPYKDLLNNIIGSVGKISKESKDYYLNNNYFLDDIVGISGLEKYYERFLKGAKAKYLVNSDNSLTILETSKKGNDLYLSIDINLQQQIESIVKEELSNAKKYPNTEYLNDTYVIISKPATGELLSMVGKRYIKENVFNDIAINNIIESFTMGSSVKGATISVGYKYNLIEPEKLIYDSCVKLKNQTEKCSHKPLGYLNAITALEQSSNYYQFLIAIKLLGYEYTPNMELTTTYKDFKKYRDMLSSYGLGTFTKIDLPNERNGIIGKNNSPDLLLNLAIGQYDTYTPIQLITYINTLANNGKKISPSLVNEIKNLENRVIYTNKHKIIDEVKISNDNIELIQKGFYYVMNRGTGLGFMNTNVNPAGKTGTSESFLDSNKDGKVDTKTLSLTMVGYFPYDDPMYSIAVVSPHASHNNSSVDYIYYITSKISKRITNLFVEKDY